LKLAITSGHSCGRKSVFGKKKPMTTAIHPLSAVRQEGAVLLICSDASVARRYLVELASVGGPHRAPLATSIAQAEAMLRDWTPHVIVLDESCIEKDVIDEGTPGPLNALDTLEPTVAALTEHAPVVVVGSAQHQDALAFLISAGAVDLVARLGNFVPVTVGLVVRRAQIGEQTLSGVLNQRERSRDFGEMLRHEVNNPLTGILGNAEMLLKLRAELPPHAVARLETIAGLAVRLRETIRRLSDCWEAQHDSAGAI
jgi:signal transduction histidine kinase